MSRIFPNTPFEDLEDFTDVRELVMYILKSISVSEITAHVPSGLVPRLKEDPDFKLPIRYLVVGNATFNYILGKASYVLTNLKDRMNKLNQDADLSFDEKLEEYQGVRGKTWNDYQYFNSMNPIRYMSQYKWKISYGGIGDDQKEPGEEYVTNSILQLTDGHWTEIENTFLIRRHLLYEILYLIDVEVQKLRDKLAGTKYSWVGEKQYELYELLAALFASERIKFEKGDRYTFAHDFLSLFSLSDKELAYSMDKVMSRKTRSRFLKVLEESLEKRVTKSIKKSSE